MEEQDKKLRLTIWAGIFIGLSLIVIVTLPIESARELLSFFKEIIQTLILGS